MIKVPCVARVKVKPVRTFVAPQSILAFAVTVKVVFAPILMVGEPRVSNGQFTAPEPTFIAMIPEIVPEDCVITWFPGITGSTPGLRKLKTAVPVLLLIVPLVKFKSA